MSVNAPPTVSRTPRTPEQKHAAARHSQAMGRFGGVLILLVFLGIPALFVGFILYGMARRNRRRYAIVLLGMLVGMVIIALSYRTVFACGQAIAQMWKPYQPMVSQYIKAPSQQHWQAVQPVISAVAPGILQLWLMALPLAPCVAVYLESTLVKTLPELRADKERQNQQRDRMQRRAAAQKVKEAPDQLKGLPIIGIPLSGDLPDWRAKEWMAYPATLLNRHAVMIGGSGTGKTEFLLRLAYLAAKVLKWKVFYLDAKGDAEVANRFMAAMAHAGVNRVAMFPDLAYHGWRGDATAILNRLMSIEDYSEPYYRAIAKTVLSLACHAPDGPPRSSINLLDRLNLAQLSELYADSGDRRAETLTTLSETDLAGVYKRYFGFFDALGRKLDGAWSFETVDAGYVLLDGLALKEEARALGRYVLEDFANYVSKRKQPDQKVLLIVDEWSAISAGGADAANLFERIRSYGAGIVVTSQSYQGLGDDADKMIGASWATIAFQCTDPERIAARAGTVKEVQTSLHTEYAAIPGRNLLLSGREHASGTSIEREQEVPRLHPNIIRNLGIGECCFITNGAYQEVRVARLPKIPDIGMVWGNSAASGGTPRIRSAPYRDNGRAAENWPAPSLTQDQGNDVLDLPASSLSTSLPVTELALTTDASEADTPHTAPHIQVERDEADTTEGIATDVALAMPDESTSDSRAPASPETKPTTRLNGDRPADVLDL
jgi:hypothetical protein